MNGVVVSETVRRHITNAGYLSYLAFLAIVALGVSRFNRPASMWPSLVAVLAIIAGSAPIGPEFSSGTLQLILVKPVKRWVYLLSRVAGVVLAVSIAAIVGGVFELAGRLAWGEVLAAPEIARATLNCFADATLTASLLVLLGSLTRAYFNAAIYLGTQFALGGTMAVFGMLRASGRDFSAIERGLAMVDNALFPEFPPRFDASWLTLVLLEAAIALTLACVAFRAREVPYGGD